MDLIKIKEYLFNTAEYSGENKNIEEWYLKQTINFINECEGKNSETSDANLNIGGVSGSCSFKTQHIFKDINASYYTDCGSMILNVTPNEYKYCPFCGKSINYH